MQTETPMMGVKAGDEVIYTYSGLGHLPKVITVQRVTAKQIVTAEGRFNRETGYAPRRDSYFRARISIPREGELQKVRDKIECANLSVRMKHFIKWEQVPLEALRDINAILKQNNQ